MHITESIWRTIGRGTVHPSEVLNILIDLDNRKGQVGLWALENELREQISKLRPVSQPLAKAWLEATMQYRATYYPETRLSKLWNHFAKQEGSAA